MVVDVVMKQYLMNICKCCSDVMIGGLFNHCRDVKSVDYSCQGPRSTGGKGSKLSLMGGRMNGHVQHFS